MNIELIRCKRSDSDYQRIRNNHYVENHGCIGRQFHYLVKLDGRIVGVISGASPVWACKPRDDYFEINKDNREKVVGRNVINNVVFRLEERIPNLGTMVLSKWRKRVVVDWMERYGDEVFGFETFIFGENRTGAMYKADNWKYVGETQGNTKSSKGMYGKKERLAKEKKLIFCRGV